MYKQKYYFKFIVPKETPGEPEFPQSCILKKPNFSVVLGKPITQSFLDANYLQKKRNVYVQAEILFQIHSGQRNTWRT